MLRRTSKRPPEKCYRLIEMVSLLLILALVLVGCGSGGSQEGSTGSPAQTTTSQATTEQTTPSATSENTSQESPQAQIAAELSPSIVQVSTTSSQPTQFGPQSKEGLGSGVLYRTDGYIVTNSHVVQDAKQVTVSFSDGSTRQGDVVGSDPITDLAVVRVDRSDLPVPKFDTSSDLLVGERALAIGNPLGLQSTVTSGVISGLNRSVPAQLTGGSQDESLVDLIQTSTPVSPGNSGGALIAVRSGEVVGITVAYLPPNQTGAEGIGFAIPSDTVVSVADQLINNGRASTPYLGVSLADLTSSVAEQFGLQQQSGALVAEVESGGPADKAGLKPQDIVTAAGSKTVKSSADLIGALRDYKPGDTIELTVQRGGSERKIDVVLGERQSMQPGSSSSSG